VREQLHASATLALGKDPLSSSIPTGQVGPKAVLVVMAMNKLPVHDRN